MTTDPGQLDGASPAPPAGVVRRGVPAVLCFGVAFLLTFGRAIDQRIFSDEHLFLGGAGLMARGEGLIYRDFFYNHMPTHALLLAALFRLTDHWVLAARTLESAFGAAIAAIVFEAARRANRDAASPAWRNAIAASVAAIFVFNPVTADVVGKAWNHNIAAAAALVGYLLLAARPGRLSPGWRALASGACASIAATSRLTTAPMLIAFPLLILLAADRTAAAKLRQLALWVLGGIVAALPAIWVCLQAPAAAYFGNFRFPGYSARYHGEATSARRLLLSKKFEFIGDALVASPSLVLLILLTVVVICAAARPLRARTSPAQARLACLLVMIAAAAFAAFAPTPMYNQYLYGPLPFAALALAWATGMLDLSRRRVARVAFVAGAAIVVGFGAGDYSGVLLVASPATWTPLQAHRDGERIAQLAGGGKILTFAPGTALEGRGRIYPDLAIGRYGVRIGGMLKASQRARLHVPDLDAVCGWFDTDPPAAVLLVMPQTPHEALLAKAALDHGYRCRSFGDYQFVWLPPRR